MLAVSMRPNTSALGIFPTAVAFLAWGYALSRTSAGRLASTTYVVPALVVVLSWLLLGEVPAPLAFLGGGLCLVGVAVSRRLPGHRHETGPAGESGRPPLVVRMLSAGTRRPGPIIRRGCV